MKILFIQTGGTIDKDYPARQKGYAFQITEPAVARILKILDPSFEYEIIPLLKKDSLDMSSKDRQLIKDVCIEAKTDKVIITHGTDTMIETARYLSSIKTKVIVLTGSMLPARFMDSDASTNVGTAIGAVQHLGPGIYIAMHGWVLPFGQVTRHTETGQFIPKNLT